MNRKLSGFTLIELLVTIAILGIVAAIAMPNYRQFVMNNRMATQTNEFFTTLNFVRSEAVKRNTRVTLCKSSNGTACAISTGNSGNWQVGWIVFVDGGTSSSVDGTDLILRVHGALAGSSTLEGDGDVANYVSYISNGQTQLAAGGMQGGTFSLCSPDTSVSRRKIILTEGTGRALVEKRAPSTVCTDD